MHECISLHMHNARHTPPFSRRFSLSWQRRMENEYLVIIWIKRVMEGLGFIVKKHILYLLGRNNFVRTIYGFIDVLMDSIKMANLWYEYIEWNA